MNDPRLLELAAVISVLSEHRVILHDLGDFEPVGSVAETLRSVLGGSGSLDRATLRRIQAWSSRWLAIGPTVRMFYRFALRSTEPDHADRVWLEHAVWLLIEPATHGWVPSGGLQTRLYRKYLDLFGRPPGTELLPLYSLPLETSR